MPINTVSCNVLVTTSRGRMDSIFYLGGSDDDLPQFLGRLGYCVITEQFAECLIDAIRQRPVDIIVINALELNHGLELCSFLRTQDVTRILPIVYVTSVQDTGADELATLANIEVISAPFSVGKLAGRIATQLRLGKIAGEDELRSTLVERNAALRELTERFHREVREAREIQDSLLPQKMPSAEGMQIAASYNPFEELGGDWYFADKIHDGRIRVGIADVSGHGLSAAFISTMVKLAMSVAETEKPNVILREMNRLLFNRMPPGRFVTVATLVFDPANGELQWARAGHPPSLIYRHAARKVEWLHEGGFALGFVPDAEYPLVQTVLSPGDLILMYTDGITEARNRSGVFFGTQRLVDFLAEVKSEWSCSQILAALLDEFDAFREGRSLKDDVTLVAIRRSPAVLPN